MDNHIDLETAGIKYDRDREMEMDMKGEDNIMYPTDDGIRDAQWRESIKDQLREAQLALDSQKYDNEQGMKWEKKLEISVKHLKGLLEDNKEDF